MHLQVHGHLNEYAPLHIIMRPRQFLYYVPRQISMYLCRKILNMNDTNIGKEFGKDRTTVGHNIEKIEESIDTNSTIKSDVNYILKDLNYNEG